MLRDIRTRSFLGAESNDWTEKSVYEEYETSINHSNIIAEKYDVIQEQPDL